MLPITSLGCASVVLVLMTCLAASPIDRGSDREELGIVERFLHDFSRSYQGAHVRVRRQAGCSSDADCLRNPTETQNVPSTLVSCDTNGNGTCVCNDCFYLDSGDGLCYTCSSYPYNSTTQMCGSDSRPNQLTAFLLSIFFSAFGAANFYIEQTALGAGQVVVTLVLLISCYLLCCPCVICCCVDKDIKGACWFLVLIVVVVILVVGCSMGVIAWWIADLTVFRNNMRLSGNGCVLIRSF